MGNLDDRDERKKIIEETKELKEKKKTEQVGKIRKIYIDGQVKEKRKEEITKKKKMQK